MFGKKFPRKRPCDPNTGSSNLRFPIGNWSHSVRNEANGSNALGRIRIHDEYSPGLNRVDFGGGSALLPTPIYRQNSGFKLVGLRVQG